MLMIRTPDEAFVDLPDYPFAPHYVELDGGVRMHYLDEGDPSAAPVLLLHGEPTWSFLYRHMIPPLVAAGHRVIAPDLIGFGKSDKPTDRAAYSYAQHVAWVTELVTERLDLQDITLFGQDWGSLIGLRVAAEQEPRVARIVIGNGGLPHGSRLPLPNLVAFTVWRTFATFAPVLPIARIVAAGTKRTLSAAERAAYDAPFQASGSKAGARAFPALVPLGASDPAIPANRAAWEVLGRWEKPFLTCFSDGDPITGGGDRALQRHVPGAAGLPHATVRGGHFLQEDSGPELAAHINALIAST